MFSYHSASTILSSKVNVTDGNASGSLLRAATPSIFTRHDLSTADHNTINNKTFKEYHIVKEDLNDHQKKVTVSYIIKVLVFPDLL